ncbi:hypothetical protein DFH09DRAFT_919710 [Mycena vulgaris]|nr:hypothetical protein DFH09DRAFT_919710 [Mycena vulgaris]
MIALLKRYPTLTPFSPLAGCVFACITFNFGPRTATCPHLDFLNLAWGWCFITALGWFNWKKGGHLILWGLGPGPLVFQFSPGATIAIPSAVFRYSNVAIQQGEKRFSFTQYTSAGVFRFVKNGLKTDLKLKKSMTKVKREAFAAAAKTRYAEGVDMYSKLQDLSKMYYM